MGMTKLTSLFRGTDRIDLKRDRARLSSPPLSSRTHRRAAAPSLPHGVEDDESDEPLPASSGSLSSLCLKCYLMMQLLK
ncbi:hypothetical protein GUJ93_ZPchr0001g29409 [Zizania palustris]|uniref:Uncharacterized protein n=1 Tax=Zizania palustris TaxID=103762 RepID=A0A8J5VQE3_ZIZPA|nr:hypothetical protein GUJ93_ZPchr0001g29409 [Zizania palustris]